MWFDQWPTVQIVLCSRNERFVFVVLKLQGTPTACAYVASMTVFWNWSGFNGP